MRLFYKKYSIVKKLTFISLHLPIYVLYYQVEQDVFCIRSHPMNYSKLKGTPQYNDERWLQYRVDFTEAKYNQRYPDLSWREELLTEAGDIFGFRFKRIGRVQ